ncbi:MAG TPA: hypothetical protein VNL14_02325 [Candidatus Acidoferrales bacterium]|nr:hypothetical protein [Candidatus Acidoferrales bacterium]
MIVRSPYLPGERARAISFAELGHPSSTYLLPTKLHVGRNGTLALHGDVPGSCFDDLKTALFDREIPGAAMPSSVDSVGRAAAFLALVLREVRARFLQAERETYRRFQIRWAVNVGIPSAGYDDGNIREKFLRAARVGWKLSWETKPMTWDLVMKTLGEVGKAAEDDETPVEVIPEVVAQAVGYARSPLRNPGLHLLVDVGASTLDICGFFLRSAQGQDCYDLLTTTVDPLGVAKLHERRIGALRCEENAKRFQNLDALSPVPETLGDYHPGCACGASDVDGDFRFRVACLITRHLANLKKRRDPYSPKWPDGIPVFLCGGGSGMQLFRKAVEQGDRDFRQHMNAGPIQLRRLPKPAAVVNRDIGDGLFHRLSVAYGLSFDAANIGSVTPPGKLEDIIPGSPPRRDYEANFISKEKV